MNSGSFTPVRRTAAQHAPRLPLRRRLAALRAGFKAALRALRATNPRR